MRIVLCDDHCLLLEAIAISLNGAGHTVVATTTTPDECVAAIAEHRPDVCLLDLDLAGCNGLAAVPRILEVAPETKVVILSCAWSPTVVGEAIKAGAVGFVRKDQTLDGILVALEQVRCGQIAVDPAALRAAMSATDDANHDDPRWVIRFLTVREREVLRRIVLGEGTAEIARNLGVANSTARTHVQNVLQKLGVHSRLHAVAFVGTEFTAETTWTPPGRRSLPQLT